MFFWLEWYVDFLGMFSGVGGCLKVMSVGEGGNWEGKICVVYRGRDIGEVYSRIFN